MANPVDPTGFLIVELRDPTILATLAAMTGGDDDPKRVTGRRDELAPPVIIVDRVDSSLLPYGAGSGRTGVKGLVYSIKCAAKRGREGDIEATHLGDVVAHFLHLRGPRTRTTGAGKVGILISRASSVTQVIEDPVTGDPYVVVNATVDAGAQALT